MPSIFISYRRADSAGYAGRLYEHLSRAVGTDALFMDIDNVPFGDDFVRVIEDAIDACDVALVLIGPQWAQTTDRHGNRRLEDPNDFVRLEVATALRRPNIRVIPVLVNDASMPLAADLPPDLQPLTRRNAIEVTNERFSYDVDRLTSGLGSSAEEHPPTRHQPAAPDTSGNIWNWIVILFLSIVPAGYTLVDARQVFVDARELRGDGVPFLAYIMTVIVVPAGMIIMARLWPIRPRTGAIIALLYQLTYLAVLATLENDVRGDFVDSQGGYTLLAVADAMVTAAVVGFACRHPA